MMNSTMKSLIKGLIIMHSQYGHNTTTIES